MIAIVDYGMGNLRSVEKALQKLGHHAAVTASPADIRAADRVILPGVGAFGAAMANLAQGHEGDTRLVDAVSEAARSGRPFLGICLGMQLLLSESEELGRYRGLDLVPGRVVRFSANGFPGVETPVCTGQNPPAWVGQRTNPRRRISARTDRGFSPREGGARLLTHALKVPHMGWNALHVGRDSPLLRGVPDGAMVYFVHSYLCRPEDPETVVATADHGGPFCAALQRGNVFATQFHPEKSGAVGLQMLDNFARL